MYACAALCGQECMGNEYCVVGNFVGERFLQILQIDYDSQNFSHKYFTIIKHMFYSQCLWKSLPLQLLIEWQRWWAWCCCV